MHQEINKIYSNRFGISFQWKRSEAKNCRKVQFVFRDIGIYLTPKEIVVFSEKIKESICSNGLCDACKKDETCRALLVETPAPQVSIAVNYKELTQLRDLVEGTLFQLGLNRMISKIIN